MDLLATLLCLVVGWMSALSGYLSLRKTLLRVVSEEESPNIQKALYIAEVVISVALVGCVALSITDTAQPRFFSLVFAAVGVAAGLVGVLVAEVRQRHHREPHLDSAKPV